MFVGFGLYRVDIGRILYHGNTGGSVLFEKVEKVRLIGGRDQSAPKAGQPTKPVVVLSLAYIRVPTLVS